MITAELNPLDRISLKLTNRYFHSTISPLTTEELPWAQQSLCQAPKPSTQPTLEIILKTKSEKWRPPYLACMSCLHLRPCYMFADSQIRRFPAPRVPKGLRGDLPKTSYYNSRRFCVSCGIKKETRGYQPSDTIIINDVSFLFCCRCKKVNLRTDSLVLGECQKCAQKTYEECMVIGRT